MAAVSWRVTESIAYGASDPSYRKMVLAALVIGLVFVFSASFPLADRTLDGDNPFHFLYRQLLFMVLGVVPLYLVSRLTPTAVTKLAYWLFIPGLLTMVLCRWSPWAHPVGGNWCWLKVHGVQLQPGELVKVVYVALLACYLARSVKTKEEQNQTWLSIATVMAAMCGALVLQKDLGTLFLITGLTLVLLFIRGVNGWLLGGVTGLLGGSAMLGIYLFVPDRWERIVIFLDPQSDPLGAGYHLCLMLATLARGGLAWLGLGMSPDKWGALPAPHTDSVFCIIGAELGILGAGLILVLVYMMTARALKIAQRARTPVAWYLGCGIGLLLGLQSIINIAVATVSMPCAGLTLPFISAGGSSLISSMIAAGIVLGISRSGTTEPRGDG